MPKIIEILKKHHTDPKLFLLIIIIAVSIPVGIVTHTIMLTYSLLDANAAEVAALYAHLQVAVTPPVGAEPLIPPKPDTTTFVTRQGTHLQLNGTVFYFVGANRYNILTTPAVQDCNWPWSPSTLNTYFSNLHDEHVNALRFFAFPTFTKNGTDFSRFDYVLTLAQKYGVYLIPTLSDEWGTCGTDKGTPAWFDSGYLTKYKPYVEAVVKHYADVATYPDSKYILMWQLINEAWPENNDFPAIYNFASDMSMDIYTIESSYNIHHLINVGTSAANTYQYTEAQFRQLYNLPHVDIAEYHDYGLEKLGVPTELANRIQDAVDIGKPLFIGESGIQSENCVNNPKIKDCFSQTARAQYFFAKMTAFFGTASKGAGAGYLIWLSGDNPFDPNEYYSFNVNDPTDPLVEMLTTFDPYTVSSAPSTGP